ncbi:unnamed protein product [Cladocopium goreaui]|uniref:Uncharacterized protein n=1 Tax=Cladocopium goreaui TaxID=2562237 RepID=A0A9P1FNX9_9DINO|nr:unnamed protein product [Cladocopium goreaui]
MAGPECGSEALRTGTGLLQASEHEGCHEGPLDIVAGTGKWADSQLWESTEA